MTQRRPNRRPDAHYQAVAEVWLAAWRHGKPAWPTTAVKDRYGINYTTAARWVKRARELGFLTQKYKRAHVCPNCGAYIDCPQGDA